MILYEEIFSNYYESQEIDSLIDMLIREMLFYIIFD
jgi:hypothetical protein